MVFRLVRLVQRRPLTSLSVSMSVMSCMQQVGRAQGSCRVLGRQVYIYMVSKHGTQTLLACTPVWHTM
jgi:hypothetical protein